MGTQGAGRKRSTKKERSTAEDDALNLIAREAEARLAAKRAARAEAREIRMKELERQQKEIFQVQKKYYGLDTKLDDRSDSKWGDIEQWMEDSERYSRSSRIHTVSDDDERMSVGSRGSVRSDLDAVGAYGGGDSSSHKKSKKKKKHKHKDKDRNGYDDDYSVISSRSSRLSDDSRVSRSSRLDLTSSRLSDDTRVSRASRLDLQPASYASSDLYSYNGLSSTRNPGSAFNGYQSALYEDSLCSGSQRVTGSSSHPLEYTSYRSSGSRASSRASSARASPVDNCGSVASFLRSAASSSGLRRDLDDVTIPDFSHVEDKDYLEKGSRAGSALTAATLTSLGGSSSRRGSGETALTVDAETSIREIKEIHELKDQIQDVETKYMQNLKEVKDALVEVEEKYRKAMVSNAQLDNEKNNLMYQVDTLKDSLMELEELLSESRRGYEEKVKEYEREKHAHTVLQFQFSEMKETLKQSEDLLNDIRQLNIKQEGFVREISDLQETVEWKDKKIGALERQKEYSDAIRIERDELREEVVKLKDILKKHGIVLGPDLNINGEIGEAEVDGSLSADQASPPAKDSQTSPTEGNSMLGNTEETQLRSSEEEAVDPEQHQEMFEEAKESHSSSDTLCNVDGVSTLETFREEQPTKEQQTCLEEDKKIASQEETMIASQVYNVKELALSKDLNDIYDESITEAKDLIICSHGLQGLVTSSEESVPEAETREGGDLGQTETKSSSVDTHSDDIREPCSSLFKEQGNKQEDVEESNLRNTESCLQQKVAQDVMKESFPDESVPAVSNTEPQLEPENADEAENDEADETSSKCQPQGAASAGKKKKRKRRGKKKGGTHEEKSQQKDGTDKEKGKPENEIEMTTRENKPTTDAEIDGSATETLKESSVDQVTNDQDRQETEGVDGVEAVEPTESVSRHEESRTDHVTDEHDKEQTLEMDNVEGAMTTTETFSHIETLKDVRADHVRDEQNRAQSLETQEVEAVEAVAPSSEISSDVETLKELRTDPRQDEENKKQTLETEKVEEVASLKSPVPETDLGTSDLIDISKSAESTDDLDKECVSSLDNSKSETGISTNDSVIHTEDSERVEKAEDEVGSVDERGSECTTNNPKNTFETSAKENTEAESQVPNNGDTSVSLPPTEGFTDLIKSLSTSEVSAVVGSDDTIMVLERKEATERVEDDEQPGAEIEQGSLSPSIVSPSHDRDDSELKADKAENEELNGGLGEAEGAVEPDSASITKHTDALGTVQSLLESAAQGEQLDDGESQTLQCEDQIEESKVEESSESEEIDISDPPKEATESESSIEQDHRTEESACAEDPEHKNSQQSEKQQVHEPGIDKSEDNDSSQHIVQESDEEDEVDDGQSFDFHDMDLEAAVAASIPENPKQEEVEEGVEVVSDESNNGISSKTESNEKRQDEPVEIIEEKSMGDRGNQVDTLDTLPRDNQNSFAHEDATSVKGQRLENVCEMQKNMPEEEVGVTDEPRHVIEEGKVLNVGELGVVAEDISRAMSLPVEEGLDAIKYELQGKHLESPKSAEEVARTKEPQDTGRDVKKSTKKGKGKGKEECKMS